MKSEVAWLQNAFSLTVNSDGISKAASEIQAIGFAIKAAELLAQAGFEEESSLVLDSIKEQISDEDDIIVDIEEV